MTPNANQLALLKRHGFQWYHNGTTDRVDADIIHDVLPAANGFTVRYKDASVLVSSTAKVSKIDFPGDLNEQWIRVHWDNIEDERRGA